jgi:7-cyano-7-deazaguanine reductase
MPINPLGQDIKFPTTYDPEILYPIPRWAVRSLLDIDKKLPIYGFDHWHAFELSWLNSSGKPQVAIGEIFFDSKSENIVESKSLKLYLNSLNQKQFSTRDQFSELVAKDLSELTHSEVKVVVRSLDDTTLDVTQAPCGYSIDGIDQDISVFLPDPDLLVLEGAVVKQEQLYSNLFKSNCPMTGQPDWATFKISYSGQKIAQGSLLAYICSYRSHQGYHEECAERIYRDIMLHCQPDELLISLSFLRRGGLDINCYRSCSPLKSENLTSRLVRQ